MEIKYGKIKFIGLSLLLAGIFFLPARSARAFKLEKFNDAVEDRFIMSPGKIELWLAPGEQTTKEIMIVNRLGRRTDFSVETDSLDNSSSNRANPERVQEWIVPEVKNFSLDQGERIKFKFDVTVPVNAVSGGHYWGIFVATKGSVEQQNENIEITSRLGVPILLTVPGSTVVEKGKIIYFNTDKLFYTFGPVNLILGFRNLGNVHLLPQGEISITNILGAKVATLPLREWLALPGADIEQTTRWDKRFLLGIYKASVSIHYGSEIQTDEENTYFFAFPWPFLLLIIILIILLYWTINRIRSKFEIHIRKKSYEEKT